MKIYMTYEKLAVYQSPSSLLSVIAQQKGEIKLIFKPYANTHRYVVQVHSITELGVYYGELYAIVTYNVYEERGGSL